MEFVPFDASEDEVAARQVLRSGVPTSMRAPITNWIWHQMASPQGFVKPYAMHTIENNLDISFGFDSTFTGVLEKKVFLTLLGKRDARNLLRIADWLLAQAGSRGQNISPFRLSCGKDVRSTKWCSATRLTGWRYGCLKVCRRRPSR